MITLESACVARRWTHLDFEAPGARSFASRRDCPVVILPSKPKHMYIDPGAGSIVIQAVSAVVIAAAASMGRVRRFVASVVERFKR